MKPDYKLVAKAKYIELTAELADRLWRETYARRLNSRQLTEALQAQQSAEAIEAQIDDGYNYFIVQLSGKSVGYFAWKMQGAVLYLSQIYLESSCRGKGMGRDILLSCERLARAEGKNAVAVNVGTKQLETQGFFKGGGYRPIVPETLSWAPDVQWETIRMEKRL